jgi:hypothetical protein
VVSIFFYAPSSFGRLENGYRLLQEFTFGPVGANATKVAMEGSAKVPLAAGTDHFVCGVKRDLFNFSKLQRSPCGVL